MVDEFMEEGDPDGRVEAATKRAAGIEILKKPEERGKDEEGKWQQMMKEVCKAKGTKTKYGKAKKIWEGKD